MSKVMIHEDIKYSSNGSDCVCLKGGQSVDNLPADIEAAWLERGICSLDEPMKRETKVVKPVEETKAAPKKKARR